MKKWIMAIVLCLIAGVVALVLIVANTRARQREYAATIRMQEEADGRAEKAATMIEQLKRKAQRMALHGDAVGDAMVQSRHAVTFVLGARKAAPVEKPSAVQPDRPAPRSAARADGVGADGPPAGEPTREMLDRMRAKKAPKTDVAAPEVPAAEAPPSEPIPPPVPEAPIPPPAPEAPKPPPARTVVLVAKEFTEAAELAHALLLQPPGLVEKAKVLQDAIVHASTGEKAEARMLELTSLEVAMDDCARDMEVTLPSLAKLSAEVEALTMAAAEERNSAEGDVLRRALAAERERLVAADMERLAALRTGNRKLLMGHEYERLAALIEARLPDCRSDAGRQAYQVAVERHRKLEWLKGYVIEQIQSKPLRWGWGLGTVTVDVTGADEKGVQITGKHIPWEGVSTAQFAKWGQYYAAQSPLPGRVVGSLQLALAVFYSEHGEVERAAQLRTQAILDWEQVTEEAARLLPDA